MSRYCGLVHVRFKDRDSILAGRLRRIHGEVGVAHELVGPFSIPPECNADAPTHRDLLVGDQEGQAEHVDDPLGDGRRSFELPITLDEDRKLVATQARRKVAVTKDAPNALGHLRQETVANCVAQGVVDDLEVVEVEEEHRRRRRPRPVRKPLRQSLQEEAAIGQAGQVVMEGLIVKLFLQPGQLCKGPLQVSVLERDGGLVGEGLEQPGVVVSEGRPLREALTDGDRADEIGLTPERADHPDTYGRRAVLGQEEWTRGSAQPPIERLIEHGAHRHHHLVAAVVPGHRHQGVADGIARIQDDLGLLGAEHLPGVGQHPQQGGVQLRSVLEDPRGLVEELQPLMLLVLRDVGLVGEEDDHDRKGQEPQEAGIQPQEGDGEQGEARVGQRHHASELDHLGELLELRGTSGQGDDRGDRQGGQDRPGGRRRECRQPVLGNGNTVQSADRIQDRERHHRHEHEIGEVEGQLDDPLFGPDEQCHREADEGRREVLAWGQDEEADHGGELAQRERMGLPPEVDLDDLQFGHRDGEGDERPGHVDPGDRTWSMAQVDHGDADRRDRQDGRQEPDPRRCRHHAVTQEARPDRSLGRVRSTARRMGIRSVGGDLGPLPPDLGRQCGGSLRLTTELVHHMYRSPDVVAPCQWYRGRGDHRPHPQAGTARRTSVSQLPPRVSPSRSIPVSGGCSAGRPRR